MTEQQIRKAAKSIAELALASEMQIDDILFVLSNNIISEEDCGRIRQHIIEKYEAE